MRGPSAVFLVVAAVVLVCAIHSAHAQYWFQSGADSGGVSSNNNGASVYIQTVGLQAPQTGAFGFWVGENLDNGAFLQVGYEIPNESGLYPNMCSPSGCNGSVYLTAGQPTWFWEYFPAGYKGPQFYGAVGSNDSIGAPGVFNRYSFVYNNSVWRFYFNNNTIGSVDLASGTSGSYVPVAYAELADTYQNTTLLQNVLFKNLSYYKNGAFSLVPEGYSYVGYGTGSQTALKNTYGVAEVPGYADYFEIGSALPLLASNTKLWSSAYNLYVKSEFGNTTGSGYYLTFSVVNFTAPEYVYVTPYERMAFDGWVGSGFNSYTGPDNPGSVKMGDNVTETATWAAEYYVNVTSEYGSALGSGWYYQNSTALIGINKTPVIVSPGVREVFGGWSNGMSGVGFKAAVTGPLTVAALWKKEYFVNASTEYGNAAGSGWYSPGSVASIRLNESYFNVTNTSRTAFYSWSGVYNSSNISITVSSPISLDAIFKTEYLVDFVGQDAYYNQINASYFRINGRDIDSPELLYSGVPYSLSGVYYKGFLLPTNKTIFISGSGPVYVKLPVYNVQISAQSLVKKPLNATLYASFKNGSSGSFALGPSGSVTLYDVPLGYVAGSARYGSVQESFKAQNGNSVSMTFVSLDIILIFVAIVVAMLAYELLHRLVLAKRTATKARR